MNVQRKEAVSEISSLLLERKGKADAGKGKSQGEGRRGARYRKKKKTALARIGFQRGGPSFRRGKI